MIWSNSTVREISLLENNDGRFGDVVIRSSISFSLLTQSIDFKVTSPLFRKVHGFNVEVGALSFTFGPGVGTICIIDVMFRPLLSLVQHDLILSSLIEHVLSWKIIHTGLQIVRSSSLAMIVMRF